ncbi:hypothetical protein [uncultured Alistipes sp.]|uniref:hypothetical protein n=1 Tax=uncultured Alistipes sp. TaxID=538949 RepID=UPI0025F89B3F|nr:hypothetical protein [uncultured Alistipes sp.]
MIYSVTPDLYRETASRLLDALDASGYFSGSLFFPFGDTDCRLTASIIVYRTIVEAPDGVSRPVADMMPVWWEFHTVAPEGEVLNDFSFNVLRDYVCG